MAFFYSVKIVWQIHKFFKSKYKMIFISIFQSCSYFSFRVNKKAASFYLLIFNPVCSRKDLRHFTKKNVFITYHFCLSHGDTWYADFFFKNFWHLLWVIFCQLFVNSPCQSHYLSLSFFNFLILVLPLKWLSSFSD